VLYMVTHDVQIGRSVLLCAQRLIYLLHLNTDRGAEVMKSALPTL
jgi:hypothetical protein